MAMFFRFLHVAEKIIQEKKNLDRIENQKLLARNVLQVLSLYYLAHALHDQ